VIVCCAIKPKLKGNRGFAETRREEEKKFATDKNQMNTDEFICGLSSVFI
jgi:hypothetical protein